jgi:O-acetyl-ADP-ribose deacetylase (regulator of RNase III)
MFQVDVIVNSTNRNLDMNVGAISRTLLKAGGDIIEQECKKKYVDGIKPGEVAVTTGGALSCNELYHGQLIRWDGGQGLAEKVWYNELKVPCKNVILCSNDNYAIIRMES